MCVPFIEGTMYHDKLRPMHPLGRTEMRCQGEIPSSACLRLPDDNGWMDGWDEDWNNITCKDSKFSLTSSSPPDFPVASISLALAPHSTQWLYHLLKPAIVKAEWMHNEWLLLQRITEQVRRKCCCCRCRASAPCHQLKYRVAAGRWEAAKTLCLNNIYISWHIATPTFTACSTHGSFLYVLFISAVTWMFYQGVCGDCSFFFPPLFFFFQTSTLQWSLSVNKQKWVLITSSFSGCVPRLSPHCL